MITISVMLATVMQVVDTTIVNVALPHMQGSMSATQDQISWVLTSYIVAAAIFTPLTGVLADRFGRKRLFAAAVIGFTLASMLCGAANVADAARAVPRAARRARREPRAAVASRAARHLSAREARLRDGALGHGRHGRPDLGPDARRLLDRVLQLALGVLHQPARRHAGAARHRRRSCRRPRARQKRGFDFFGFALLSIAIGALQLMLDRGNALDWFDSTEVVLEAATAALALYLFLVHMFTADKPFIEPGLFADRNFVAGVMLMFTVGVLLLATMALLPPFLQSLLGFPVITAGYVLAPRGVGTMVAMMVVGRLVGKVDTRLLVLTGTRADGVVAARDDAVQRRRRHRGDHLHGRRPGSRARLHLRAADRRSRSRRWLRVTATKARRCSA